MSMPKLLLWIATVGVAIYAYVFGFNRILQNVADEFSGLEQNVEWKLDYFVRETHLDQFASNVRSEVKSIADRKPSEDTAKKEHPVKHRRSLDETESEDSQH